MEVLLFALFFISALIFFIAGKDDFGRTENKLKIKKEKKVEEDKTFEVEGKVKKEDKGELKVTEQEKIETPKELKKES